MRIFITANSPGELAGWVVPVVRVLKAKEPEVETTVVLTPCQFASGSERDYAERIPGVDEVVELNRIRKKLGGGTRSHFAQQDPDNHVLFLGGDAFYAVVLARKLGARLYGYMTKPRWKKRFDRYFVSDVRTRKKFIKLGVGPSRVEAVGHLCLDSLPPIEDPPCEQHAVDLRVTFLPGSRPAYVRFLVPFYLKVADELKRSMPELRLCMALSPFTRSDWLGTEANPMSRNLSTPQGHKVHLLWNHGQEAMSTSQLLITIPGTNTLQAAGLGVPMVVVVPLNRGEQIPLEGLPGLLFPSALPFGLVKRGLLLLLNRWVGPLAWPNILADRRLVPELRGWLDPTSVARKATEILESPESRSKMSRQLRALAGKRGAADIIANALLGDTSHGGKSCTSAS
jgi:lipid-A-disaccharide synthase